MSHYGQSPTRRIVGVSAYFVIMALGACASTSAPLPFADISEPGISFWQISPATGEATFAFHWREKELLLRQSTPEGLSKQLLPIDSCPLLQARLLEFRESLVHSVEILFVRRPALPSNEVTVDGPVYRARYVPKRYGTSVELSGGSDSFTPWPDAAARVRERAQSCLDAPVVR